MSMLLRNFNLAVLGSVPLLLLLQEFDKKNHMNKTAAVSFQVTLII